MNSIKPDIKEMAAIVNDEIAGSKNKAVFSVLIFTLLKTLLSVISVIPVMAAYITNSSNKLPVLIITFAVSFIVQTLLGVIQYGLTSIFDLLTKKEFVTLGFLFIGFKKDQKRVFITTILYNLFLIVLTVILVLAASSVFFSTPQGQNALIAYSQTKDFSALNTFIQSFSVVLIFVILLLVILLFPFVFRYLNLINDSNISSGKALFESYSFTMKHFFKYIGLLIYSTKIPLAVFVICNVVSYFIPERLSFLSSIISIVAFIAEINILVRVNFCNVIFYYSYKRPQAIFKNYEEENNDNDTKLLERSSETDGEMDSES